MTKKMSWTEFKRHWFRIAMGWLFIFLGIIGLVLPILQGILFLAIGIALLSPYIPLFRRLQLIIYKRFPKLGRKVVHLKRKHGASLN